MRDHEPADGSLNPGRIATVLERVRSRAPLVHASMNTVGQAFVANALVALGADVSMTAAADDIADMVPRADAFLVNLGTLDPARAAGIEAGIAAGAKAAVPFVLDPVKVDRAPGRRAFAEKLIARGPAIVKGNAGEMEALSATAFPPGTVRITTGPVDVVALAARRVGLANGTRMLARVIATGCAGGAVIAAARAVEWDPFLAGVAGLAIWEVAAEIAAEDAVGPGSFAVALLDRLAALTPETLAERLKILDAPR